MFRFESLDVWKLSVNYGKRIYRITEKFPSKETFGLTAQIKRASLSISSNIAEGSGNASTKDFCNYLDIAIKSTLETVSQLMFAKEIGYLNQNEIESLYEGAEMLTKKITRLKKYLKNQAYENKQ